MVDTMNGSGALSAPERNHFFYGKLMDVEQFEKEQRYLSRQRRLVNRLVLGAGVVSGLKVVPGPGGTVVVEAGLAIDGLGREIVVPAAVQVPPAQPTDAQGAPTGAPLESGVVTIAIAYAEQAVDLVPVLVAHCDTPGNCAPSTVRESFRVLVRTAEGGVPDPPTSQLGEFPLPAPAALHTILCDAVGAPFPAPPDDPAVVLARVTLPLTAQSIDSYAGRRLVYGNARLYELILSLAERLGTVAGGRILRYASGDGQTAVAGTALADPIGVALVDGGGNPVAGGLVQFAVASGGGAVSPAVGQTDGSGLASAGWTLGPGQGEQQVTASAVGSSFTVTFRATAT
jgi:hypothetical protein